MGIVVVAGNVLKQVTGLDIDDAVDEVAVTCDVVNQIVDVHADNAVNEIIAVDNAQLVKNMRQDDAVIGENIHLRVDCILPDAERLGSALKELHRRAVGDDLCAVERANDSRRTGEVKIAGSDKLRCEGLRVVSREAALRDAGDDDARLFIRDASRCADIRQDRARIFSVKIIRLGIRHGRAEVDIDHISADSHNAVGIGAAAGDIVKQVTGLDTDDAMDKIAVTDDVIHEVIDIDAHDPVNEVIAVDNVDAVENMRERGHIPRSLQRLDAARRRSRDRSAAKQLRRSRRVEQAAG